MVDLFPCTCGQTEHTPACPKAPPSLAALARAATPAGAGGEFAVPWDWESPPWDSPLTDAERTAEHDQEEGSSHG